MGNYESAGVSVGITLPFDANDPKGHEKAYAEAKEWAEETIKDEIETLKNARSSVL